MVIVTWKPSLITYIREHNSFFEFLDQMDIFVLKNLVGGPGGITSLKDIKNQGATAVQFQTENIYVGINPPPFN